MQVALLGGTGDIGEGLALRLARDTDHDVIVGSRDADRADECAAEYGASLAERGVSVSVSGAENGDAAERGDVVVAAVPPYHVRSTVEAVADRLEEDTILVSPAVGLSRDESGFYYDPPSIGSVTELVASVAPDPVPVVGAFHNLPAGRLSDLEEPLEFDVVVLADEDVAKSTVAGLVSDVDGLRPVDAGGLGNAAEVEALTAVLCNVRDNAALRDPGVRFG
jgi:NADPH-dependent F420 reductase